MRHLLVLLLLLNSFALAQQVPGEKTNEVYKFEGLNTKSGDFFSDPSAARIAHNIDWSRWLGSIAKRRGYSYVDSITGVPSDSITSLYGAYFSDGSQFLLYTFDIGSGTVDTPWCSLRRGPIGSTSLDSGWYKWHLFVNAKTLYPKFPVTGDVDYAMLNDIVYIVNGVTDGAYWDGKAESAKRYPVPPPGTPYCLPISDSGGLDGTYRYAFVYRRDTSAYDTTTKISCLTNRVRVNNGKVLLSQFTLPPPDIFYDGPDTATIEIWRTRGGFGRIDVSDSIFFTGITVSVDSANWRDASVIDSISDDSLDNHNGLPIIVNAFSRRNTSYPIPQYGSVGYVDVDTSATGMFAGGGDSVLGFAWMCTSIDTVTGQESDSSATMLDMSKAVNRTIVMPELYDSTMMVNLYRAPITYVSYDTINRFYDVRGGILYPLRKIVGDSFSINEVIGYRLVGTYAAGDSVFDTLRYDSLLSRERFRGSSFPEGLRGIFPYANRMWGHYGSRLYMSRFDSAGVWSTFNFIAVNQDDGDEITLARPSRTCIRVYKNKSSYNVYQDGNLNWNLAEVANGIGCVAPKSGQLTPYGYVYLSDAGVILENDGVALERTIQPSIISSQLDNFDKMSISEKSKARGYYVDNKYLLYVPAPIDTTYVFDFRANSWSTWSIPIGGATLYGSESSFSNLPGDTLFFYKPNGSSLFRLDSSRLDDDAPIWSTWESAPMLIDEYEEAVTGIGIWFDAIDSSDFLTFYDVVDGRDTILNNLALFTNLGDTTRYRDEAVSTLRTGAYHQILMKSTPSDGGGWNYIDKLNVSFVPMGRRKRYGTISSFITDTTGGGGGATVTFGTITGVIAGYGITGGGTFGDVTVALDTTVDFFDNIKSTNAIYRDSALSDIRDTVSIMVVDSAVGAERATVADSVGVDNVGWGYEWFYLPTVHVSTKAMTDSIVVTFPATGANGDTLFLLVDSAGNITPTVNDTVSVSGMFPFSCTIDSIEIMYMTGAEIANNWLLCGTSGLCDSVLATNTTDLTSSTWDTTGYAISAKSIPAGYMFAWKYDVAFGADNERLRVAWVRVRYQR